MAKRRSTRWNSSRRKISASKIPKSIARVRKQRIVVFNTMQACEYTCLAPDPECTTPFRIALLRNVDLQNLFGDNVKIVRMQGSIHIDPLWQLPYAVDSNCVGGILADSASWLAWINSMSRSIWQLRAGMCKVVSSTTDVGGSPTPDYDVAQSFDWSEPAFMRRWEHMWFFKETLGLDAMMSGAHIGVCSNVTKPDTGSLVNALAAGTGNINTQTGAITTACQVVSQALADNSGPPQRAYRTLPPPRPFRMSVNSSRVISLKENEGLEIQASFGTLFPGADCFPGEEDSCFLDCSGIIPCIIRIIPNVTMTLQYG